MMGMGMSMSMQVQPKLLQGLGCIVCGHIHDMPEDAATQEKIEDIATHCSSNPILHRRVACPKCGTICTSTWYITITKSGNVRSTEHPAVKSKVLAGPFNKWELPQQLARFWEQGKVPHTINNEVLPPLRCAKLLLEQGNILEATEELQKGLSALESIEGDVAKLH